MAERTFPPGFSFASELREAPARRHSAPAELLARLPGHSLVDLGTGDIRVKMPWAPWSKVHEVVGHCRLASAEELASAFPQAPFLEPPPACPFRGERLAWLLWDIPGLQDETEYFGKALAELSLGRSVNLRDGRFFDALVEFEFPLSEVADKWGFGGGSLVLGGNEYESYVHRCLEEALRKAGVPGRLTRPSTFATLHNPYRLEVDAWTKKRLEAHSVRLWARHPLLLRPRAFFGV